MRTEYDTIFLGCSCYALGCAAQRPADSLILEAGEGLGGEFTDALRCGPIARPAGPAEPFYQELLDRGIMTAESAASGRLTLPAVNLVLNRMALERGLHILFHARVIAIRKVETAVAVEMVCNARIYTLRCRRVIDTRYTDAARIRALDANARFGLCAQLDAPALPQDTMNGLRIQPMFLPGDAYACLPVPKPDPHDRETLLRAFEGREDCWLDAKLIRVAHAWAAESRPIREKTAWGWFIPASGFANPVQAYALGLAEQEAMA